MLQKRSDRYERLAPETWVSADKSDTLDFVTGKDFYKSDGHFHHEHYDYQIMGDSIQIGYRGTMLVLVRPTRHRFSVIDGCLTIDFTNTTCYGFSREIMTYRKEP
jgi:hypothetical protein